MRKAIAPWVAGIGRGSSTFRLRSPQTLYRLADRLDGSRDGSLGGVLFHLGKAEARGFLQSLPVRKSRFQRLSERPNVAGGKYKIRPHRSHQVARRADFVARDHRAAAAHGFVDHHREGLVLGGKNKKIGPAINGRQPRLIEKTQKAHPVGHVPFLRLRLELAAFGSLSGKKK